MADFIDRAAAENLFYTVDPENDGSDGGTIIMLPGTYNSAEIEAMLESLPAADVEPVRHGRWVRKGSNWRCSACDKGYRISCGSPSANTFDYCPNCGAKMDGGADNVQKDNS